MDHAAHIHERRTCLAQKAINKASRDAIDEVAEHTLFDEFISKSMHMPVDVTPY